MNTYELYQDIEETQKRLEKQIETILQFESEGANDETILRKGKESVD